MTVYLVGGGPGDPSLLTVRARELLEQAEVVAYDELCSDALLSCVPAGAELLPVGRRGHDGAGAHYRLHPALLDRARAGKRVVRLKAGDPLVFGRGGEEAEELRAAGLDYEIVPGVSSALGAAAYAGIPLTHRAVASSVTLTTGHAGLAGAIPDGTLVLFMAGKKLAENLQRLVDGGRDAATPAAWIAAATTGRQRVIVGTVADLAARVDAARKDAARNDAARNDVARNDAAGHGGRGDDDAPALVFVGEVVALRERISWIESRPLFGRRIVVGRARPGRSQIAARLSALGADVVEMPDVGVAPPSSWQPLDRALVELSAFTAVVFASAEAVTHAVARLAALRLDVRSLPPIPLVAVGTPAGEALRARGLVPAVETAGACADALRAHDALCRGRLLVVGDDGGRPQLAAELRSLGAVVEFAAAYRHTLRWLPVRGGHVDLVIAPSSSAALHLGDGPHGPALRPRPWLVMGPVSEAAAQKVGVTNIVRAEHDDVDAVVARAGELLR